jgi:KWG repeat domain protein
MELRKRYKYIGKFKDNLALVRLNGRYGLVDQEGKEIVPTKYNMVYDFIGNFALVVLDGKFGMINREGKETIAPIYSCIEEVGDIPDCDVVKVRLNGKWGIVSKADGKVILEIMYDNIFSFFKEDNFAVIQLNERYGLIERKFRELVPPIYGITEIPEVKRQIVKVTENIYFFNEEEMNTTTE